MSCVSQEVKDIYYLLEHEFLPSDLALKVLPLLNKISKLGGKFTFASSVPEVQFSQYVPALEKLATLRLLQQVSNVYQTMKIDNLAGLIPSFDFSVVEKISVDAVKQKFLSMKVDHMKNVVIFCKTSLEADGLKDHLASFAEQLNKARQLICPPDRKQSKLGALLPTLSEVVAKEHKRLLARKSIIEKRKEEQERQLLEMEREEESKKLRLQKVNDEAEKIRLEKESEVKRPPPIDKANLSRQTLLQISLIEQQKQRQDIEKKLQKLAKTMDHLERAKREEAAPLIEAAYQQRLVEERILHEREQQMEVELSKQRHAGDLHEKERLSRMMGNKEIYQEKVVSHRQAETDRLKKEREDRISRILQSRKQEREKMRKLKYFLQVEEERRQKLREAEEAQKRQEAERKKKEQLEHQAKLDAIAEKQKQREREIEEKAEREKREALLGRPTEPALRPYEPPARPLESGAAPAAAAASSAPGKYVPKFRRGGADTTRAPPPEADRWGNSSSKPDGDRWDRNSSFGSGGGRSSTTWRN
ncbi:unnamed protein product [Trifolium pratense]|uniref:Uncharacterized protein n=1 Tax=Trifolium pratense TaxID=57577 RepID=A0ACB0IKP7_TRIPR|nr:unnamed protein product [Trifolium pratense]